jgi:hypothetical protein
VTEEIPPRDVIERSLKEALEVAYNEVVFDERFAIETDGSFPVLLYYSFETNEPVARYEIRYDIKESN